MSVSRSDDGTSTVNEPGPLSSGGFWTSLSGSARWTFVGLTMVLAAAAVFLVDDVGTRSALIMLSPLAAAAAIIDVLTHRIPTVLAMACGAVALSSCIVFAIIGRSWMPLIAGLVACAAVGIVFFTLWRFTGLGFGDVRLAAALAPIAGTIGWQAVVAFVVLAHLLAVPLALCALARQRRDIAFGPAIVGGLYVAVALAPLL